MPPAKTEVALQFLELAPQKLHCNICFSAMRTSFLPKAALQQTKNCTATLKKLRCRKVALSWHTRLGLAEIVPGNQGRNLNFLSERGKGLQGSVRG